MNLRGKFIYKKLPYPIKDIWRQTRKYMYYPIENIPHLIDIVLSNIHSEIKQMFEQAQNEQKRKGYFISRTSAVGYIYPNCVEKIRDIYLEPHWPDRSYPEGYTEYHLLYTPAFHLRIKIEKSSKKCILVSLKNCIESLNFNNRLNLNYINVKKEINMFFEFTKKENKKEE